MNKLTTDQRNDIITALQMRICYIETGTVTHRAKDVARGAFNRGIAVNALNTDQMKAIIRMEETVNQLFNE